MKNFILVLLTAPVPFANEGDWKSLFNGRDLDGWSVAIEGAKVGEDPKGHIVVRDGVIHMYADTPVDKRGDFGLLFNLKARKSNTGTFASANLYHHSHPPAVTSPSAKPAGSHLPPLNCKSTTLATRPSRLI